MAFSSRERLKSLIDPPPTATAWPHPPLFHGGTCRTAYGGSAPDSPKVPTYASIAIPASSLDIEFT